MAQAQERGKWGEELAAREARRRGLRLLARNVRLPGGELDLVCKDGEVRVFVEVKTRARAGVLAGVLAVDARKQRRLARAARAWLIAQGVSPDRVPWRFDLCVVTPGPTVTWLPDAFRLED